MSLFIILPLYFLDDEHFLFLFLNLFIFNWRIIHHHESLIGVYICCLPNKVFFTLFFFFFLLFILYWSKLINSVVIVSGEQQRNSTTHIHVSTLPRTPLPPRLPCNVEQSSLCCSVDLYIAFILYLFSVFLFSVLSRKPGVS